MRIAFALEYSLGHATHADNLKWALSSDSSITPVYLDIPFDTPGGWTKLPVIRSNWSVRASLAAARGLRALDPQPDAAFFHTQVTSLFSVGFMRRVPSIVSLDATPIQMDAIGSYYGHVPSRSGRLEALKNRWTRSALCSARHLISWSEWAKQSLVADYGIAPENITVIPPGIDTGRWRFNRENRQEGQTRILFVGGDFKRKGGDTLLAALNILGQAGGIEADIVSPDPGAVTDLPNVKIHRGLRPNAPELLALFEQADIFAFPTRADCLPLAIMEALAAGLPAITSSVGALPEAVVDGRTGIVVPPDDPQALAAAIRRLADDPALRARMSGEARNWALERFDGNRNYGRLVDTIRRICQ